MKIQVDVTEEHIKSGRTGSAHSCPIALAIKDAAPQTWLDKLLHRYAPVKSTIVSGRKIYLNTTKASYYAREVPEEVGDFIHYFDTYSKNVAPFSFSLDLKKSPSW